jgi:hypothetical protein
MGSSCWLSWAHPRWIRDGCTDKHLSWQTEGEGDEKQDVVVRERESGRERERTGGGNKGGKGRMREGERMDTGVEREGINEEKKSGREKGLVSLD